jgi:hypothetical protein
MGRFVRLLANVSVRVNVTDSDLFLVNELLFLEVEGRVLYVATHDLPRLKTYLI